MGFRRLSLCLHRPQQVNALLFYLALFWMERRSLNQHLMHLGPQLKKITVGAFIPFMQTVATGVAIGIATGVAKIAFNLDLWYLLVPPYTILILITFLSSEDFVNFGWDSAGVTTGPITVPLVLAMGVGNWLQNRCY